MQALITYLTFDGNAREAMTFYKQCLGGELVMLPFSEGECEGIPEEGKDRIMHATLTTGPATLMASDSFPGAPFQQGNNFSITISCDSVEETEKLFKSLGEKGKVVMPLQDTFWGAYFGIATDQFGINWMFNFDRPQKKA